MEFYGNAGDENKLESIDVSSIGVRYDGQKVKSIRCHRKVADSLHRVLVSIDGGSCAYILEQYAGCYNNRPMRGGSLPSLHARGAAIDLDPVLSFSTGDRLRKANRRNGKMMNIYKKA